jgi:two-component system chemotaxis response regulator CheB
MAQDGLTDPHPIVIIGGSTGSIEILLELLPGLHNPMRATMIIVVHRRNTADSTLSELLAHRTKNPLREVDEKESVDAGVIYLAPADYHLLIESDHIFSLDDSEKVNYTRPAIDVTFESAAAVYGPRLTGILLSGANTDGTNGLLAIRQAGGRALVQKPETARIDVMPRQAIKQHAFDQLVDVDEMVAYINTL